LASSRPRLGTDSSRQHDLVKALSLKQARGQALEQALGQARGQALQ
jgi:hypothetical protein